MQSQLLACLRAGLGGLVLLGLLAVMGGGYCPPKATAPTPRTLQDQVDVLGDWLCAIYDDRGIAPPAGPNGSFICPYPPEP
jgi:hypothetical protein